MTKATVDNMFIGSVVEKRGETFNVYKVNKTSIWAGTAKTETVLNAIKHKEKEEKFLDIMKRYEAKKLIYSGLTVDEKNDENVVLKKSPSGKVKKEGHAFDPCCMKMMDKYYKLFKAGKGYRVISVCPICGRSSRVIVAYDNDIMMVNSEYKQISVNMETRKSSVFKDLAKVG